MGLRDNLFALILIYLNGRLPFQRASELSPSSFFCVFALVCIFDHFWRNYLFFDFECHIFYVFVCLSVFRCLVLAWIKMEIILLGW